MIVLHVHMVEMRHSCWDNTLLIYYRFDTEVLEMRSGIDTALHSVICTSMVWVGADTKVCVLWFEFYLVEQEEAPHDEILS